MITASIVLYNTRINLVKSLLVSYAPAENRRLFFIDNSPIRNEEYYFLEHIEGVHYIYNNRNLGYGKAHNIGIQEAIDSGSKYHIVLNPDISFSPEIIDQLVSFADNDDQIVYILPKVVYPNGDTQYLCKLLPTPIDLFVRRFLPEIGFLKKINDRYTLKMSDYNKIMNPPCLSGCFMFMRTETLKKQSLRFDERFFMYCEDFDLIRRLHRYGKTLFYPQVQIIHDHAQESYKSNNMLKMHIQSAIKYFNKYGWFFDAERKIMNQKILNELRG